MEKEFKIGPKEELAIVDGLGIGIYLIAVPLAILLGIQTIFSNQNSKLESILHDKEFVMKDVNGDGRLDMISKDGIYLHKSEWNYEKVKKMNKFFRNEYCPTN